VHPDTLIETPGGRVRIADFKGGPVWSWDDGRMVIANASAAFPCTKEHLYELVTERGRIIATDQHRLLTPDGWRPLSELGPGDAVVSQPHGCDACRPVERVRLVSYYARLTYWDLHVDGTQCYLAGGLVHHNSAKSHDRASACVLAMLDGKKIVGLREVQRSIKDSVKALVESKIGTYGMAGSFRILRDEIQCDTGGAMIFRGLQDHTAESIKSLEGYDIAWGEEAQTLSERSLMLLKPTIRAPGSELWFTWNPRFETDPIDRLLRGSDKPDNAIVIEANWQDNPFFPEDLRADMERDKRIDMELYLHVWEGQYQRIGEGAYYANELAKMYAQDRICAIPIERNEPIFTAWDIGVDDMTAIWVCQVVGFETRIIDFIQDRGNDASYYCRWIRDREYDTGIALLPHDAGAREKGTLKTYEDHVNASGISRTVVLPRAQNLMADIQEVRAFLPRCYFDKERCEPVGLKLLGRYRVAMDERMNVPLPRPVKDGSDHCADAFRTLVAGAHYLKPDAGRYLDPNISPNVSPNALSSALGYSRRTHR
jgi:phage terminase large subunit